MGARQDSLTVIIGGVDRSREYQAKTRLNRRLRVLVISGCVAMAAASVALAGIAIVRQVAPAPPDFPARSFPQASQPAYYPPAAVTRLIVLNFVSRHSDG